ncbi:uncharacterized protein [Diadema setosum]|uniref:uncharacterized protein n=1 Tax=Diadema setosum TaxID=31175 RepID=UPI003B3A7EE0
MPRINWTWVFVALLVAVSLSSVSFPVNGAVVTTEPGVRLRQGLPGLVPCTVTRKLSAVSWKKGDTIESATTVVILDISNSNRAISGPGFEDGEFTVASNYSLIFTNARSTNSGRYYCEVSDYETGVLYRNYSDVKISDPPVITDARRVLQYGNRAILRCRYEKVVYVVSWRKGDEYANAQPVVALDTRYEVNQRQFGDGYDQGWYNISDDYSLVISSARIQDGGKYYCVVSDLATGRLLVNSTYVDIVATPQEPFPEIDTCVPISSNESMQTCNISADSNTTISLTCTVTGYYPNITMTFSDTSNQARMIQGVISNDTEGLLTQIVTIELLVRSDPVKCTGSGIPFETTRTTQGVFIPMTSENQTDANNIVTAPAPVKSACEYKNEY